MGKDCKLYYNSATNASPTWVLITEAIDVAVSMPKGGGEIKSRASSHKKKGAGLKGIITLTFGYLHNAGTDTVYDALLAAYNADTPTQFAVMDGAIATTGQQGAKFYGIVDDMSYEQPLEEAEVFSFQVSHTRFVESSAVVEYTWFEVPA